MFSYLWTARVTGGGILSDEELREASASADILSLGMLADAARRAQRGRAVTFVRVAVVAPGAQAQGIRGVGEVRLDGEYPGVESACRQVETLRAGVGRIPISAWSLADIEAAASRASGQQVSIRSVAAEWKGLSPQFQLQDIHFTRADGTSELTLPRVEARLSWTSLLFADLDLWQKVFQNSRRDSVSVSKTIH